MEFKPWPKIPRVSKCMGCVITEKLDGTNACVVVEGDEVIGVQSRKRFITPESDNFGFASWVRDNSDKLKKLGDGYHYGEWVGPGIQQNPLGLEEKQLHLFSWWITEPDYFERAGVYVVDTLYQGEYSDKALERTMTNLWADRPYKPEGVIVTFPVFGHRMKATYNNSEGKWKNENS